MVRKLIYFSGVVQGVGFRFRCQMIADQLHLTGWCRNDYDGRVETEVQGEEETIHQFIERLKRERFIEIERVEIENIPVIKESQFRVTY